MFFCKSNFYFRHGRSRANLTSWREGGSMKKGHKVKQIMCPQYQAVIRRFSTVVLLFVCFRVSCRPFHSQFPCSAVLSVLVTDRGARLRSPWPRARPPACDSTVSTNAFRGRATCFFRCVAGCSVSRL